MQKNQWNERGFTMVELLIFACILAIITAIVVPAVVDVRFGNQTSMSYAEHVHQEHLETVQAPANVTRHHGEFKVVSVDTAIPGPMRFTVERVPDVSGAEAMPSSGFASRETPDLKIGDLVVADVVTFYEDVVGNRATYLVFTKK